MYLISLFVLINPIFSLEILEKNENCPFSCTCKLEHLTETAIYRFMQNNKKKQNSHEVNSVEFNDVLYDDNLESELLDDKPIVRSAICILHTEIDPLDLITKLPSDLETLTLIQGYNTGSKTIKFSYLSKFKNLLSLELLGPNLLNKMTNSSLISEINLPLPDLKYLNLENIQIKNSKIQIQKFVKEFNDVQTFEYVQKIDTNGQHPLTMVQQGTNEEILPYEKYKQQDDENKIPLFIGFKNLFLLRITHCELNNVHWAMFDGLNNLQYLILDKNNLRFIPPFAFYGTPNLKTLSLAHNNLLDIQITDLAGLLELEYLDLSYNNFSQLSELSLPPFPKLKLADFGNNPITVIFPNTFEVMNTTDSLIIGSNDVNLSLMTNSFLGLNLLKALTLNNLKIRRLKRDLFVGMPSLNELTLTGDITEIEFDTFLDVYKLKKLILSNCNVKNVSMDAFIGLENLQVLDLSKNQLEHLPPAVFDQLLNIKEIYLNENQLIKLPRDIFGKIHPKMIRLNENPWHCSCEMSEWKPMIINRIKQKVIKSCDFTQDKGVGCLQDNRFTFKYVYENKVTPKCVHPKQYVNWSVFHAMRRLLKCPEYKPKIRKHEILRHKILKHGSHNVSNDLNVLPQIPPKLRKIRKPKKHFQMDNNILI
ncbi:insulin-like growth factor-binding protein complex acid labile subunit [Tribolium madens]|uniref:insulin-like growth factor-binding protein complex acid labile subunit n=1 Tax=Tribolium madens TaxID=41895 RepID=UPI001CF74A50|nr:insulin-like growth factor-binding protein complex acid labile subunit [Tribolium madens]